MMKSSILRWSLAATQSVGVEAAARRSPRGTWPAILRRQVGDVESSIARMPDLAGEQPRPDVLDADARAG